MTASLRAQSEALERHAAFDGEVTLGNLAREVARARRTELRQEPHVPGIDTEEWHAQSACTRGGHEERAITTDRQHQIDATRGRILDDLNPPLRQRMRERHRAGHSIRSVAMTHHQYSSHNAPPAGPSATAARMYSVSSCGLIGSG